MSASASSPCFRFVERVTRAFLVAGGHDTTTLSSLRITAARPGNIEAKLTVGKHNLNRLGSVHGGLLCTIVDTMGSLALSSKGLYSTGVSTDIHTTFARAAGKAGDELLLKGEVTTLGRTLATTRVEVRHPVSDALLAFGSHTKFVGKAYGHEENVEFDDEGTQVVKGKQPEQWTDVSLH
ncbi:unnamed protein product [Parajaminaea phylloscopi]